MNFNHKHYEKYRRYKEEVKERYCFAINKKLGENGRIKHSLMNKKFKHSNKIYTVDSVNVHSLNGGYYYFATLKGENNSHACKIVENINSTDKFILDSIKKFKNEWELCNI